MKLGGDAKKAWKDIWGCGQGIGAVKEIVPARVLIARLKPNTKRRAARLRSRETLNVPRE